MEKTAAAGQNERSSLLEFMKEMRAEASFQREMMMAATQKAEEKAEQQRQRLSDEAAAATRAMTKQQADMIKFLGGITGGASSSAQSKKTPRLGRHHDSDDDDADSSSDDGAATDVDDPQSCARALEAWKTRTCNTPKDKRHLVAWHCTVGAPEAETSRFTTQWGRKLEPEAHAGPRDQTEALAIEAIILNLQRALTVTDVNVARYACVMALQTAMQMGQRTQLRFEGAAGDVLTAFDESLAVNERKVRRRAVDHLHLEQLAAAAKRKHPRKPKDNQRRDFRGGSDRRSRSNSHDAAAASTASATPKKTP